VPVANVRGRAIDDALQFVRESWGEAALQRVVAELPPEAQAVCGALVHDSEWYPLDHLVVLLRTARRLLAQEDPDFFRRQGFHAGQREKAAFLGVMVATPELISKTAPTIWRMFYDVGRLVALDHGVGQIHDFPTTPELCQRFIGIWEGIASTPEKPIVAKETQCRLRGDACCEMRLLTPDGRPFL
jgi:hypothetical protein